MAQTQDTSIEWPDGGRFALALSHDVDRVAKRAQFPYYMGKALCRLRPGELRRELASLAALARGDDPYWNFARIMELEGKLGVRSTLFFLDERGKIRLTRPRTFVLYGGRYDPASPAVRDAIRGLDAGGWEIALHGSYDSYLDERLLAQEKAKLEGVLGHAVQGVRQHYLRLAAPRTWRIHASLGLKYDSTLGYADRVGLPRDPCRPFYPADPSTGEEIPVLEIPLGIMDIVLSACRDPWSEALHCIESVESARGVLTLDWHQRVFNPWEHHDQQGLYVRIIEECRRRRAWVAPLGEVADWWTASGYSDAGGSSSGGTTL